MKNTFVLMAVILSYAAQAGELQDTTKDKKQFDTEAEVTAVITESVKSGDPLKGEVIELFHVAYVTKCGALPNDDSYIANKDVVAQAVSLRQAGRAKYGDFLRTLSSVICGPQASLRK